jgi:hypothetical protein
MREVEAGDQGPESARAAAGGAPVSARRHADGVRPNFPREGNDLRKGNLVFHDRSPSIRDGGRRQVVMNCGRVGARHLTAGVEALRP